MELFLVEDHTVYSLCSVYHKRESIDGIALVVADVTDTASVVMEGNELGTGHNKF